MANKSGILNNGEVLAYLGLPKDIVTNIATGEGTTYTASANEFLSAIYNKIGYQTADTLTFDNPFARYDSFPVRYGSTIENVWIDIPTGYKFDNNAENPFAKAKPTAKALYVTINYELQYKQTIEDSLLRRAALNEYGFSALISCIMQALNTARDIDEYYATISLLSNNANMYAKGFEDIKFESEDVSARAKQITKKIIEVSQELGFPSTKNNKLGARQVTKVENQLLVIKQSVLNTINLDYLAGVYNLNKVDLLKNIIPVESFKVEQVDTSTGATTLVGEDLDFVILDTRGFDCHKALEDGGMIYNPEGKYTNHYANLWKIIAFKQFYNARAFKFTDNV